MSIVSLTFEPWHLDACEFDAFHERHIVSEDIKSMASNAPAVTLLVNDSIVAVIGYFKLSEDAINVYVIPTIHLRKFRFSVFKRLLQILDNLSKQYARVQTISYADGCNDKWMRCLGFQCEGSQFRFGQLEYKVWAQVKS